MYLLYLDDAGSTGNAAEEYLVLGGIAIFEAQVHWLTSELDTLAERISPHNPVDVEFHASEIFSRRTHPWKSMTRDEAKGVLKAVLKIVSDAYDSLALFACAIHKDSCKGQDPMMVAFEDLCSRFDRFLMRHSAEGEKHRGLIILDESAHETSLQTMAKNFRKLGTKWGAIKHLADVPLFVDSRMSRPIQAADHVAYATFRRYNAGDCSYFDLIAHRFDQRDGKVHGLCHKHPGGDCMCPACLTRRF